MIASAKIGNLYAGLRWPERARLLAGLVGDGRHDEVRALFRSLPRDQGAEWNRAIGIARRLHSPLAGDLALALTGLELAGARLRAVAVEASECRLRWLLLHGLWDLIPFPITASEHAALLASERGRPHELAAFAQYLTDGRDADEVAARGWRPEVAALLAEDTERTPEEWDAAALALLAGGVKRGELPKPTRTPDGPAVPYGALYDWLGEAMPDYGPGYFSPVAGMLGGDMHARWAVRPDEEDGEVRARRGAIARELFLVARLDAKEWPAIDPPATVRERERQGADLDARWPWQRRDLAALVARIGADAALYRCELATLEGLLADMAREDFHGADPTPPGARGLLAAARAMADDVAEWWEQAGRAIAPMDAWPAMPDPPEGWRERQAAALQGIYREDDR